MRIEILGTGCAKCVTTEENVRQAVAELGVDAEILKVSKVKDIVKYDVLFTPAVVVNGEVRVSGQVPGIDQLKEILAGEGLH